MLIHKFQTIVILGAIMCLLYSPSLFSSGGEWDISTSIQSDRTTMSFVRDFNLLSPMTRSARVDSSNMTLIGRALYGSPGCVFVNGSYAYLGAGGALLIFDTTTPNEPIPVGQVYLPGFWSNSSLSYIYVSDSYAYVAAKTEGLYIVDVSDPANPYRVSRLNLPGYATGVWVNGSYAYVGCNGGGSGLRIIDVSDPYQPEEVGDISSFVSGFDVCVVGSYAYVATWYGMRIIDISDPASPMEVAVYEDLERILNVAVCDSIAYLTFKTQTQVGFYTVDVSDPLNPYSMGTYIFSAVGFFPAVGNVFLSDTYAYLAGGWDGIRIVDIFDPYNPLEVATIYAGYPNCVRSVSGLGSHIYAGLFEQGLKVVDISDPVSPYEVGSYETGDASIDVTVSGNYAYVADRFCGLKIVDISNVTEPFEIGSYDWEGQNVTASCCVKDTLAYVVNLDKGLRILDVSDPTSPIEIGYYLQGYPGYCHIKVMDSLAYINSSGGLRIFNVSDPTNPDLVGNYDFVSDIIYEYGAGLRVREFGASRYVFCCADCPYPSESLVLILDVTNPSNPTLVSSIPCDWPIDVEISGNYAYVVDGGTISIPSKLRIIDISDLNNPLEIGLCYGISFQFRGGIAVEGSLAYIGTYVSSTPSGSGCRVVDVSDTADPTEVGYYETDHCGFGIFFSDPYIFLADRTDGLYILQYTGGVGIEDDNLYFPTAYSLSQNYPNPFNPTTTISFSVTQTSQFVNLEIYNIKGQKVKTLVSENLEQGQHSIVWYGKDENGKEVGSGIYLYKLQSESFSKTRKMILLK